MNLSDKLAAANKLATDFDLELNGVETPSSERELIAAALLDQAQEHCRSIVKLIEADLPGSAFALARVSFETAVRGIWILRCATPGELEKYKTEKLEKTFATILNEIETFYGANGQVLTHIKTLYWSSLCSYTHGGYLQACRRLSPGEVSPRYTDDEKAEMVRFSEFTYFLAAFEILQLVGNFQSAGEWLVKFQSRK